MARALITLPAAARPGEVIELRVLIAHPMETGFRPGADGRVLARDIIQRFNCRFNGQLVFSAEMHPAVSANPFVSFHLRATESGTLEFEWQGDNGFSQTEKRELRVA